jgi:tRNA (guanosine-2'-O-)-methyltransferase
MIDMDYFKFLEGFVTAERREKFEKILRQRTNHLTVVVEDVYQLHNTSAVMRSCEVFGVQELHVVEERFGKTIDKEIAMGAQKWVDVYRHTCVQDAIDTARQKGYRIIATTPHQDDTLLDDFDLSTPAAIFFGTEKEGLSSQVIEQADGFLKIPMAGFTESLNISVSAAIILQNLTSRLRKSEIDWRLTEEEILAKRLDWMKKSIKDIQRIEERYFQDRTERFGI